MNDDLRRVQELIEEANKPLTSDEIAGRLGLRRQRVFVCMLILKEKGLCEMREAYTCWKKTRRTSRKNEVSG